MSLPTDPLQEWSQKNRRLADALARTGLGDTQAFAEVYRQSSASLLGVILRIQPQRAVAEEVLQDVFVSVWKNAGSFSAAQAQPMTWLTSIARNRAIDSLRRAQAQPQTVSTVAGPSDAEEAADALDAIADPQGDVMAMLQQATDARALNECMQSLNPVQRQSIALTYYCGLSHSELASQLRQPLGTVKSWVRRGLQGLKTCLDRAVVREATTRF